MKVSRVDILAQWVKIFGSSHAPLPHVNIVKKWSKINKNLNTFILFFSTIFLLCFEVSNRNYIFSDS